jgi:hypothetical protein
VKVLAAAFAVERVSIGSITEGAPFVHDRLFQHAARRTLDPFPLRSTQEIAAGTWVDSGEEQNLGRVEVANSGHGRLVQQGDLDRSLAVLEPRAQLIRSDLERVDSEFLIHQNPQLVSFEKSHGAEAAAIPEQQLLTRSRGPKPCSEPNP